jgi:hypothetical protein
MSKHLTPTEVLERLLGGALALADLAGLNEKTPLNWRRPSKIRDPGDLPSVRHVRQIRAALAGRGFDVPLDWLIYGATEAEVAALKSAQAARAA